MGIAADDHRIGFLNRIGGGVLSMHDMEKGIPLRTAGLDCYAFLGDTCGESTGAHLNQDRAIIQAVDPLTGKDVPEGEWGSLVVTTFERDNGVIRYNLEESCKLFSAPCPCGETTMRGIWGGRFTDIIRAQGKRLHPYQIEAVFRKVPDVNTPAVEWQMVRPADENQILLMRVERGINASAPDTEIARACYQKIKEELGLETEISIVPRDALPRSSYKIARIVDK
jgi:phenylacetate-CoA ligase